jgi:hypothetical protein
VASSCHDSQTEIRRIPFILAQEEWKDWKASEFGNVFIACCCGEARARSAVFQEAMILKIAEGRQPAQIAQQRLHDFLISRLIPLQYA